MLIQILCNLFSSDVVLFIKGIHACSTFVNAKQITIKLFQDYGIFFILSTLIVDVPPEKNALQKGNYDQSVFKSVDRLKSALKNAEAMYVLPIAYDLALKEYLHKIEEDMLNKLRAVTFNLKIGLCVTGYETICRTKSDS